MCLSLGFVFFTTNGLLDLVNRLGDLFEGQSLGLRAYLGLLVMLLMKSTSFWLNGVPSGRKIS
jgi:hypothetical protein